MFIWFIWYLINKRRKRKLLSAFPKRETSFNCNIGNIWGLNVKKFKDYVYAVRYSLNTCRKNKKLFIPEMIVIAIVSLCLPLLLNYLSKYIIDCITRSVEAEHFLKTLILWIAIILCLKVMSGIAQYYYSKENRYLRCDVAQRINHLRMSVPYEITLDHN